MATCPNHIAMLIKWSLLSWVLGDWGVPGESSRNFFSSLQLQNKTGLQNGGRCIYLGKVSVSSAKWLLGPDRAGALPTQPVPAKEWY